MSKGTSSGGLVLSNQHVKTRIYSKLQPIHALQWILALVPWWISHIDNYSSKHQPFEYEVKANCFCSHCYYFDFVCMTWFAVFHFKLFLCELYSQCSTTPGSVCIIKWIEFKLISHDWNEEIWWWTPTFLIFKKKKKKKKKEEVAHRSAFLLPSLTLFLLLLSCLCFKGSRFGPKHSHQHKDIHPSGFPCPSDLPSHVLSRLR